MLRKRHLNSHSAADEVLTVLEDLLGLVATHPQSPHLQLRARMTTFAAGQLDAVLDEGRAAKLTCMRGTFFVEADDPIPLVAAASREGKGEEVAREPAGYSASDRVS